MAYKKDWSEFYDITRSKPPRDLLVEALKFVEDKGQAIDIGGGALRDTKYLLGEGFEVTVIDKSPLLEKEAQAIKSDKLHIVTCSFEDFEFPVGRYVIASAMYSLPFCEPKHFDGVISMIKMSLKHGAIFCGQFFGNRDEWSNDPKMSFLTVEQAKKILDDMEVISFKEEEKDDKAAKGETKHWHLFHFIARK